MNNEVFTFGSAMQICHAGSHQVTQNPASAASPLKGSRHIILGKHRAFMQAHIDYRRHKELFAKAVPAAMHRLHRHFQRLFSHVRLNNEATPLTVSHPDQQSLSNQASPTHIASPEQVEPAIAIPQGLETVAEGANPVIEYV
jgi:hypothetical protein